VCIIIQHIREDEQAAVEELLEQSKNKNRRVKMKDSHGYAPVHYAAKFNRPEIMEILVENGAGMIITTI
jgi:ankyrin repeat protein